MHYVDIYKYNRCNRNILQNGKNSSKKAFSLEVKKLFSGFDFFFRNPLKKSLPNRGNIDFWGILISSGSESHEIFLLEF
jgi:hypothetical protein